MKMKMTIIAMLLTSSLHHSYAAVTVEWAVDIREQIENIYDPDSYSSSSGRVLKPCSDGGAAIMLYSPNIASTNYLYVFDSEGSLILEDAFFASTNSLTPDLGSLPHHIIVTMRDTTIPGYLYFNRIYHISEAGISITNTETSFYKPTLPNAQAASNVFHTFNEFTGILTKYKLISDTYVGGAVASGIDGSNYILNWDSEIGESYQIQSSTNLTDWIDVGSPIAGNGSPITWANALTNSTSFFRVITN